MQAVFVPNWKLETELFIAHSYANSLPKLSFTDCAQKDCS